MLSGSEEAIDWEARPARTKLSWLGDSGKGLSVGSGGFGEGEEEEEEEKVDVEE